jgi:hypothetical protein
MPFVKLKLMGAGVRVAACAIIIGAAALSSSVVGAQLAPAQIEAWKNWSYALALQAATWGWPARDHVRPAPQ